MKFLSLFAGIGGLDLGLERAGMTCVGQVECNPFCLAVLAKHWPHVPRWAQIETFTPDDLHEQPDLVAAGFPCQPVSQNGKKKAQDDERWLWPQGRGLLAQCDRWSATPQLRGSSDGVPNWVDRLHALGNAVVPAVAELVGREIIAAHRGRERT